MKSDRHDLFAAIGALRGESDSETIAHFVREYSENRDIAMKLLLFARDVRGGLGERRVFRVILRWLADNEPVPVRRNLEHVAEYGRYDDFLCLMGAACDAQLLDIIRTQLAADNEVLRQGGEVSLLTKWLPSVNASSAETVLCAQKLAMHFGMSNSDYRRTLVELRAQIRIIENYLRERDYSFDYSKQPPSLRINAVRHLYVTTVNAITVFSTVPDAARRNCTSSRSCPTRSLHHFFAGMWMTWKETPSIQHGYRRKSLATPPTHRPSLTAPAPCTAGQTHCP